MEERAKVAPLLLVLLSMLLTRAAPTLLWGLILEILCGRCAYEDPYSQSLVSSTRSCGCIYIEKARG